MCAASLPHTCVISCGAGDQHSPAPAKHHPHRKHALCSRAALMPRHFAPMNEGYGQFGSYDTTPTSATRARSSWRSPRLGSTSLRRARRSLAPTAPGFEHEAFVDSLRTSRAGP